MNNQNNNKEIETPSPDAHGELSYNDLMMTSWENNRNDHMVSGLVLGRYYKFLRYLNILLMAVMFLMVMGIVGLSIKFVFFHQHELFIFLDGTDISCVFNPRNGEMIQNDK